MHPDPTHREQAGQDPSFGEVRTDVTGGVLQHVADSPHDPTRRRTDLAGLVEALLSLHQPGMSYSGLGHPRPRTCQACLATTWPCPTVVLIAEVTGSPVPEQQLTPGGVADFHRDGPCGPDCPLLTEGAQ